jgi:hypothetical protein
MAISDGKRCVDMIVMKGAAEGNSLCEDLKEFDIIKLSRTSTKDFKETFISVALHPFEIVHHHNSLIGNPIKYRKEPLEEEKGVLDPENNPVDFSMKN